MNEFQIERKECRVDKNTCYPIIRTSRATLIACSCISSLMSARFIVTSLPILNFKVVGHWKIQRTSDVFCALIQLSTTLSLRLVLFL